ncbi:hypothetical protein [Eggerthia catenaformis]|uniref:hypothetical protein n=1 Tax=Eggerthia catenaformis TaxID=31973 RepID=UPI0028ED6B55|nr:hypothetical protein [Eggerthia catenaformis]
MNKLRYRIYQFMQGRYGLDTLNQHLNYALLVLIFIHFFIRSYWLNVLIWVLLIIEVYRMLSKKIYARQKENEAYLRIISPLRDFFHLLSLRRKDKEHAYYRCPQCKQITRIPKGRGKVDITCPQCHCVFERKS